jgi:hypothetical protein
VRVTRKVVSEASIVFVITTESVTGGRVSVSMTVFVVGGEVFIMVMDVGCGDAVAAGPPSTGTTEYVALLTSDSSRTILYGIRGKDELNKKSEGRAKNE